MVKTTDKEATQGQFPTYKKQGGMSLFLKKKQNSKAQLPHD